MNEPTTERDTAEAAALQEAREAVSPISPEDYARALALYRDRRPEARSAFYAVIQPQMKAAMELGFAARAALGITGRPTAEDVFRLRELLAAEVSVRTADKPQVTAVTAAGKTAVSLPAGASPEDAARDLLLLLGSHLARRAWAAVPNVLPHRPAEFWPRLALDTALSVSFAAGWHDSEPEELDVRNLLP